MRSPRKPLRFEVTTEGEPNPVAVLGAQLIALGVEPARRIRMETRLRAKIEEEKNGTQAGN
jgi:hypothetical protein